MPTLTGTKNDVITTTMVLDKLGRTVGGPGVYQSGRSDGIGNVEVRRIAITPQMCMSGTESSTRSIQANTPGDEVLPSATTTANDIRIFATARIQTASQALIVLPTIPESWYVANIRINMTNTSFSEINRTVEVFSRSSRTDSDSDILYFHITATNGGRTNATLNMTQPFVQDNNGERYLCAYVARDNSSHCIIGGFISLKRVVV